MELRPYDDPGAVLALEAELAEITGRPVSALPRDENGDYQVMAAFEGCSVRLVAFGPHRYVQVYAWCERALPLTLEVLAEVNQISAELPGARVYLDQEGHFTVSVEMPLSALGSGELRPAIRLVTEVVVSPAFFRPQD